ncbi:MAG: chromosomal replication initiation protein DnaA [Deltaproteobacteria bacterium GWC2_42_11]|nr:MAG: chromosomal replication initiation protein DnaA [Deltaproteobacteria bacterium GWC2_42_11]HBO83833.1 chromosomal replication initiator protein DnaA [Deltaproteobacteria bacterium]
MNDIWQKSLLVVKHRVDPRVFDTWFKPIKQLAANETSIELEVPNRFFLEWLKDNYTPLLQDSLKEATKREYSIVWRIGKDKGSVSIRAHPLPESNKPSSNASENASDRIVKEAGLAQKYTFENFVVGSNNEFAHAACFAVANHLSSKYNPLFLYSGAGLGKTHLLQAIGNRVIHNRHTIKVYYYTSERFMNEFINCVRHEKMTDFKNKLRNTDILLIDDVQFWAGKEGTQEEFFHTFNALYDSHRQIVLSSDKYPKDIRGLDDRLRSRFAWGLIADIQPPGTEVKIAILKKKAEEYGITLSDDVANYLAAISGTNIRELEGYLIRVGAVSSLSGKDITLNLAKDALKNIIVESHPKVLTIEDIQEAVAKFFNIKVSDLRSKRRHQNIALPRQIAMYLAREYINASFSVIGELFGGKDHSTVIHACKKVKKNIDSSPEIRKSVESIMSRLK